MEGAHDTERCGRCGRSCTPLFARVECTVAREASRRLKSRHDGQPYVDPAAPVDESRTMSRHNAGDSSSQNRASTRIPISTAPPGSSGNPGSCISQAQEGNFRPRLFLASARLSSGSTTKYQPSILGSETRPEHPAGSRQRRSAPTTRMDNSHNLGMRNQAYGRTGTPDQRVSRYDKIEIDQPSVIQGLRPTEATFPTTSLHRGGGRSLSRNARQTWEERRCL